MYARPITSDVTPACVQYVGNITPDNKVKNRQTASPTNDCCDGQSNVHSVLCIILNSSVLCNWAYELGLIFEM